MDEPGERTAMPTALAAAATVRTGGRRAVDLVRDCFERIARHDGVLRSFVHLDESGALEAAERVDRLVADGRAAELGPLAGVPFGVKDLEHCIGMPTTFGSRWYAADPPATHDEIHVARLRAAGAIPIGKTATPELGAFAYTASPLHGVTHNPWDPTRTPGGSSGGSAAAVSAGLVPFCTASDGGGSIRTPASFTGLPGLRACYGRIPTLAGTHVAQNAGVGVLATTVADTAALLDVIAGPHPLDRTCLPAPPRPYLDVIADGCDGLRIGWSEDLGFATVDPEVAASCRAAAERFAHAIGASMQAVDVGLDDYISIYVRVEGVDQFVGRDPGLWTDRLGEMDPLAAPGWRRTPHVTLPKYATVEAARRQLVHRVAEVFDRVDLLLTPMSAMPPFAAEGPMPTRIGDVEGHGGMAVVHAMLANLVNLPSMSVPAGLVAAGLPVGMQVLGPRFREDLVLAAAARYEAAHPWPRHAPGW